MCIRCFDGFCFHFQQNESMMTWEGTRLQGKDTIVNKLAVRNKVLRFSWFQIVFYFQSLTFTTSQHEIISLDAQPSVNNSIVVFVSGNLRVSLKITPISTTLLPSDQQIEFQNKLKLDQDPPLKFSQVFTLLPTSTGSYFVLNDMFRLNIG